MKTIKKLLLLILLALGIAMIYLGVANKLLPPALTGVGFGVIALLFVLGPAPPQK